MSHPGGRKIGRGPLAALTCYHPRTRACYTTFPKTVPPADLVKSFTKSARRPRPRGGITHGSGGLPAAQGETDNRSGGLPAAQGKTSGDLGDLLVAQA